MTSPTGQLRHNTEETFEDAVDDSLENCTDELGNDTNDESLHYIATPGHVLVNTVVQLYYRCGVAIVDGLGVSSALEGQRVSLNVPVQLGGHAKLSTQSVADAPDPAMTTDQVLHCLIDPILLPWFEHSIC